MPQLKYFDIKAEKIDKEHKICLLSLQLGQILIAF